MTDKKYHNDNATKKNIKSKDIVSIIFSIIYK